MKDLRQTLRQQRRALSESVRKLASENLFSHFLTLPFFNKIQNIAAYIAFDGEIDPVFIIKWCWENQKNCYLPRLSQNSKIMQFVNYHQKSKLKLNQFNIPEPDNKSDSKNDNKNIILSENLDLILLPLVAFDKNCHRLGMGKGFYDATLKNIKGPFLLGLGYYFQCVDNIISHENDVKLNAILTDEGMIHCEKKSESIKTEILDNKVFQEKRK
jgi:5-formyltetrahydrofolate cyclo-ligase